MANFTFEKYNSLPEQVEENKENIKKLCSYIKDVYHTNEGVVLNTASISVAKSLTNADQDVVDGWLFDSVGSFFKITGGDEYALLIEYYTSFKGEDGRDGADDIDDNVIANNKLWSSDKTYTEIGNAKDKGIYYTTTEPTLIDTNVYALDQMLLGNADFLHTPVKISDLIIYIDANNNPKSIYKVNNISSNILSLSKIADYANGSKKYIHYIYITYAYAASVAKFTLRIKNNSNIALTFSDVLTYLSDNSFNDNDKLYSDINGTFYNGSNVGVALGIRYELTNIVVRGSATASSNNIYQISMDSANVINWVDTIVEE